MPGAEIAIEWRGRPARAWVPEPLAGLDLDLSADVARRTEQARAAVRLADAQLPARWEPLVRLLLRAEGVASSNIEGLRASPGLIALAEADPESAGGTAAWIADNLTTLRAAVTEDVAKPLTVKTLGRWHTQLMQHGSLPPEMVGCWRTGQGWIGGSSPRDAVFVPPPPELIEELMLDLIEFSNKEDLDSVTQAALAHAQFETIHPYADGNGRIGRVLVSWMLARREQVLVPPPLSVLIARDSGGYLAGLYSFREGDIDAWVGWFADIVRRAGDAEATLVKQIKALLVEWREALEDLRSGATARKVIEILPECPILSAALVAKRLGVSERAARDALDLLVDRDMLERFETAPTGPGRPRGWWLAEPLIDAVSAWLR